nr:hypothetical protein Iba_chr14fCG8000 [Ipomoea batatas]
MEISNNNNNKGLFQCKAGCYTTKLDSLNNVNNYNSDNNEYYLDGVGVRPQHFDYSLPFPPPLSPDLFLRQGAGRPQTLPLASVGDDRGHSHTLL